MFSSPHSLMNDKAEAHKGEWLSKVLQQVEARVSGMIGSFQERLGLNCRCLLSFCPPPLLFYPRKCLMLMIGVRGAQLPIYLIDFFLLFSLPLCPEVHGSHHGSGPSRAKTKERGCWWSSPPFPSLLAFSLAWLQACTVLWVLYRRQTWAPDSPGLLPRQMLVYGF
jgi:hypothetical protein